VDYLPSISAETFEWRSERGREGNFALSTLLFLAPRSKGNPSSYTEFHIQEKSRLGDCIFLSLPELSGKRRDVFNPPILVSAGGGEVEVHPSLLLPLLPLLSLFGREDDPIYGGVCRKGRGRGGSPSLLANNRGTDSCDRRKREKLAIFFLLYGFNCGPLGSREERFSQKCSPHLRTRSQITVGGGEGGGKGGTFPCKQSPANGLKLGSRKGKRRREKIARTVSPLAEQEMIP